MPKGSPIPKIILRLERPELFSMLPAGMKKEILSKVGLNDDDWDQDHFNVKMIGEDELYLSHYEKRIDAINAGVQFLLKKLPAGNTFKFSKELGEYLNSIAEENKKQLKELSDKQNEIYNGKKNEIVAYQNSLANYTHFVVKLLQTELGLTKREVNRNVARAEELALFEKTRPVICTVSTAFNEGDNPSHDYIATIDAPLNPFDAQIKADFKAIQTGKEPEWFVPLTTAEKDLIKSFLKDKTEDEFGSTINALSSKMRNIPALANYAKHTLITYIDDNLTTHSEQLRSSHIASRDAMRFEKHVRIEHAIRNLEKMLSDAIDQKIAELNEEEKKWIKRGEKIEDFPALMLPILYQTLITPFKEPDLSLNEDKLNAIVSKQIKDKLGKDYYTQHGNLVKFTLITTNHPLNYGKFKDPTTAATSTADEVKNLLELVTGLNHVEIRDIKSTELQDALKKHNPLIKDADLPLLAEACKTLRQTTLKTTDLMEPYRELYLSSLEQLVAGLSGGCSIGSCVSGKDRKAIEIAHTDAMKAFYRKFHHLPPMIAKTEEEQDELDKFADIFAEIYCTKHQMALAELNADGSFGTKTPGMYLPEHLRKGVEKWYERQSRINPKFYANLNGEAMLTESNILASNNEIKKIGTRKIEFKILDLFKLKSIRKAFSRLIWPHPDIKRIERSTIYKIDDSHLSHFIDNSILGIKHYLAGRREKLNFFAKHFDEMTGQFRAEAYQNLLQSTTLTVQHKTLLLYALLASKSGKNLQSFVYKEMGFATLTSAQASLRDYLVKQSKDKLQEVNSKVKEIVNLVNNISTESDKQDVVQKIKQILKSHQEGEGEKVVPDHHPHQ